MGPLLEREGELAALAGVIQAGSHGSGAVVVVKGPPGIGKTALCQAAVELARAGGMTAATASGSELERDFSYGVIMALFEALAGHEPGSVSALEIEKWFEGGVASPAVGGQLDRSEAAGRDRIHSVRHGLYRSMIGMAERTPLLVVVDDAQWADAASQRFLFHLARRIEGTAVTLLMAVRDGEEGPPGSGLSSLLALPELVAIRPAPLSAKAVGQLIAATLGQPDDSFVDSCLVATGGIPYFVVELVAALHKDGVRPIAGESARVSRSAPETLARSTWLGLARMGPQALEVAKAMAVLGPHADPHRIGVLTGLSLERVVSTLDTLMTGGVVATGLPLRFAHPILASCIYAELPPGERDGAHRRAASLLAADGCDPEEAAAHLMATAICIGDHGRLLWAAAEAALARGAPESATAYLRRLRSESAGQPYRSAVCHFLGQAEALARDPQAADHLLEAYRSAPDPRTRAAVACHLADVWGMCGRWEERIPLLRGALAELGAGAGAATGTGDLVARLEIERRLAGIEAYDSRFAADYDRHLAERRELVEEGHPAGRALALLLAAVAVWRARSGPEVDRLVHLGLDHGRFLRDRGSADASLSQAVGALLLGGKVEAARRLVEDMGADAERRGSRLGLMQARINSGWLLTEVGDLAAAETAMRTGLEVAQEAGDLLGVVCALRLGLDAFRERGMPDGADRLVGELRPGPGWEHTLTGAFLLEVRAQFLLDGGQEGAGAECLRRAGAIYQALGITNLLLSEWRATLALVVGGEEGRQLIAEEVEAAERFGAPRALSRAYRVAAVLSEPGPCPDLLARASVEADRCPSVLEQARCRVELGVALRRQGRLAEARQTLRCGLELARRCGAARLLGRAGGELRRCGSGAPQRGRDVFSLTPAEERVARLAAQGLTNAEIGRECLVSPKTVENQLGQVYRKLGVGGRRHLFRVFAS